MKENLNEIIYFELNNWSRGEDYPNDQPFIDWMGNDLQLKFDDEEWVRKNKLCVVRTIIDMSVNYCVTTTREWIEENCPNLLTNYMKYIRYPDEDGCVQGRFGDRFLPFAKENIGITKVRDC